ncbi:MAG: peptidase M48 [Alphaproteobacteria bacterium HGW-Alphaproteobacteria-2]|nr:MAG: peptidase M48 [Alphaproteobacteria bacterium HGW-Alphaproteobacteria-2]
MTSPDAPRRGAGQVLAALALLSLFGLFLLAAAPVRAQALLRDPDIEHALRQIAAPVFQAAGVNQSSIRILVVSDDSLNAFVADGQHILIHSGLLLRFDTAAQLQGVIAHELAHITQGHLARRPLNMQAGGRLTGLGIALAIAAAIAGAPDAGVGIVAGTTNTAMRSFFVHTRAEESGADQTAARYMTSAGIDPRAMMEVLEIFRGQEALSAGRIDPYALTHPLSAERIRGLEGHATAYDASRARARAEDDYWFQRMKIKLSAFLRTPPYTLRQAERIDNPELAALARAIAHHRTPKPAEARAEMERLMAMRPDDPYYYELKGQILLESRDVKGAAAAYGRAVQLAPREYVILADLGRAQLASGDVQAAYDTLSRARLHDAANPRLLRDLAMAEARLGMQGQASVTTAERFLLMGQPSDARLHAERALGALPQGSTGWLRAQDVLSATKDAR